MNREALARRLATVPERLQALVDSDRISGAVTLVWQSGAVIHRSAVGLRDIEAGLPMRQDTIFRIASMTKPITSVAALMLVDQGGVSLADPITKWLPEFRDMKVLAGPAGPLDQVVPAHREITVLDLMTHRSGLAYAFNAEGSIADAYDRTLGEITRVRMHPDEWLGRLAKLPLLHQPGERMHYGHSTEVLGYLVERASGTRFHEFLRARIFEPLGMRDTAFHVPPDKRSRLAKIYSAERGVLREKEVAIPEAPPPFCAGGGMLVSTADDYLAFARMLLAGGAVGVRLLAPETAALMRTNHLTAAQRRIPFVGKPYWDGLGFGLGLSIIIDPARHAWMGRGNVGAFGWPGVWGTWWQADPKLDAVMIYLIQNLPSPLPATAPPAAGDYQPGRPGLSVFQDAIYGELRS